MVSELLGVAELTRKLRELGRLEDGKAIRTAARAGMKPAFQRAQAPAPISSRPAHEARKTYKGNIRFPGFLRRSVRMFVRLSRDKRKAVALLGVRKEAFYGTAFVELGRGRSKGRRRQWLVPALESTQSQVLLAVRESLRRTVARVARKR